ncbi:MAG: hypothetical protein ACRECY_03385, partial [Phyllobacterium sp.]
MSLMGKDRALFVIALLMWLGPTVVSASDDAKRCVAESQNANGWLFVNNCDRDVVIEICFEETSDTA